MFHCTEVRIPIVHRVTADQLIKVPRVSDLSGMPVSSIFALLSKLTSKIICMLVCVTMSKKSYKMQSSMKSRILTDLFLCWPEMAFFQRIFMMQMTRLDVVYEWKLIRKFQKWLYNLHMNPIATRRNVKSDFRIQTRNVILRAQNTVPTEYKKMWHYEGP